MAPEAAPVLIAYDGSDVSRAAVRHAAELFAGRPAVLVTVWEPGLAPPQWANPTPLGWERCPRIRRRSQRSIASSVSTPRPWRATELSSLALLGLAAEAQAVPDEVDVADTLIGIARERGAAVVVVGSHGIGLRRRLLGSVSRKLIEHCDRPVLVIRGD